MFFSLLIVTFVVAVLVTTATIRFFDKPIASILAKVVNGTLASAWQRYITFAAYVVGISGGVNLFKLEQYINARHEHTVVLALNAETWTLEVYRTIIQTLQSLAWMLLVVFVVTLIAYAIVSALSFRRNRTANVESTEPVAAS